MSVTVIRCPDKLDTVCAELETILEGSCAEELQIVEPIKTWAELETVPLGSWLELEINPDGNCAELE